MAADAAVETLALRAREAMAATGHGSVDLRERRRRELSEAAAALRPIAVAARAVAALAGTGLLTQRQAAALSARIVRVAPPPSLPEDNPLLSVAVADALPLSVSAAAADATTTTKAKRSFKVAVVLSPPESAWGPIQTIRRAHDAAYSRWPPHVNLLWPFAAEETLLETRACERLAAVAAATRRFRVSLREFCTFEHSSKVVVWLRPDSQPANSVETLRAALAAAFPEFVSTEQHAAAAASAESEGDAHQQFTAHLTVGQFPKKMAGPARRQLQSRWAPIEFDADCVQLLVRTGDDEPFHVHTSFPFLAEQQQ